MTTTLDSGWLTVPPDSPTFWLPAKADVDSVRPGDYVQLIFKDRERLWVKVTAIRLTDAGTEKVFEGGLANESVCFEELRFGDEIAFGPEYIIGIHLEHCRCVSCMAAELF